MNIIIEKRDLFAVPLTITEREMTKEQINAMAGCKVKIVED